MLKSPKANTFVVALTEKTSSIPDQIVPKAMHDEEGSNWYRKKK